jgi:hypothetical protein
MKNPSPVLYALGLLEAHEAGVIDREDNPEPYELHEPALPGCEVQQHPWCGRVG